MTIHKELREFVVERFVERRRRTHGAGIDPVDALNFRQLQQAMGRENLVSMALCVKGYARGPVPDMTDDRRTNPVVSPTRALSYEVRKDILAPLAELRLNTARVRVVTSRKQLSPIEDRRSTSGERVDTQRLVQSGALTAAWLVGAEGGDCEGMIAMIPLPVSAGVLYLAGSAAEAFAKRIRREGLEYTRDDLLADLRIRSVRDALRLHRAVTYLKLWDPETRPQEASDLLIEAYRHKAFGRVGSLRVSMIEALMFVRATSSSLTDEENARNDRVDSFFEEEAHLLRHPVTASEHRMRTLLQMARDREFHVRSSVVQPSISFVGRMAIADESASEDADREDRADEVDTDLPDSGAVQTTVEEA